MNSEINAYINLALVIGGTGFVIGLVATLLAKRVGRKLGIVDRPDHYRKIHRKLIPTTGGCGIMVAIVVTIALFATVDILHTQNIIYEHWVKLMFLAIGGVVALAMGTIDDIWDIRARYKVLFQLVAALLAYYCGGFAVHVVTVPLVGQVHLGFLSLPVTLFWFLGCMNVINLLDGMDGLAGGVSLFVCLTMTVVATLFGNPLCIILAATLSGAILAFLMFNFNPASIFLGDGGSMLVGFLIASFSIIGSHKAETTVALLIPFIALGLPVFDTALAMIRRWSRRVPISVADRKHLHHTLLQLGLGQKQVAMIFYSICITMGLVAVLVSLKRNALAGGILVMVGILAIVAVKALGMLSFSDLKDRIKGDMSHKRMGKAVIFEVEKAIACMAQAQNYSDAWQCLTPVFEIMSLDHALFAFEVNDEQRQLVWTSTVPDVAEADEQSHSTEIEQWSLFLHMNDTAKLNSLEVWKKSPQMPLPDTARLLNMLRVHIHNTVVKNSDASKMILDDKGKNAPKTHTVFPTQ